MPNWHVVRLNAELFPIDAYEASLYEQYELRRSVQAMQAVSRGGVENVVAVLSGYWPQPGQIVNAEVAPRWPLRAPDPALFAARKAAA